jgi:hypothetical protein
MVAVLACSAVASADAPPRRMRKIAVDENTTLASLGVCVPARVVALPTTAPDEAGYRAAVARIRDRHAAAKAELDPILAGATSPSDGANLGAVLYLEGALDAAIYATAASALADAADPVTASNLGVLLVAAKQLPDAATALLRAEALAPAEPAVATNRGWLAYKAGDAPSARVHFSRAVARMPAFPPAELGLGLLDGCAGAPAAAEHLGKAFAGNRTESVAAFLTIAAKTPLPPLPRGDRLQLPPLPIDPDPKVSARLVEAGTRDMSAMTARILSNSSSTAGKLRGGLAPTTAPHMRGPARTLLWIEHTHLDEAKRRLEEAQAVVRPLRAKYDEEKLRLLREATRGKTDLCPSLKALVAAHHRPIAAAVIDGWARTEGALHDYVEYADPVLDGLTGLEAHLLPWTVESQAYSVYTYGFFRDALLWSMEVRAAQDASCRLPRIDSSASELLWTLVTGGGCDTPGVLQAGLGPVKLELGCESLKIQGGSGIIGYGEYGFESGQVTTFLGVGAQTSFGTVSGADAKLGGYVVYELGLGFVDAGGELSASIKAAQAGAKGKVRYSMVDGYLGGDGKATLKVW